jgi:hypothetical protein
MRIRYPNAVAETDACVPKRTCSRSCPSRPSWSPIRASIGWVVAGTVAADHCRRYWSADRSVRVVCWLNASSCGCRFEVSRSTATARSICRL